MSTTKNKASKTTLNKTATLTESNQKQLEDYKNQLLRSVNATVSTQIDRMMKQMLRKQNGSHTANGMVETTSNGSHLSIASKKKGKKETKYDVLVATLKKMGHPSTTDQIAIGLKKHSPKFNAWAKRKEKGFMQFIYSAVSHLTTKGTLVRESVNQKGYAYSLPEWSEAKASKKSA